jgi:MFS family permease
VEESKTTTQKEAFKGPIVLLKEAWNIYKQNFVTYIFLMILSIVASIAGVIVLALAGVAGYAISQSWVIAILLASVIGLPVLIYLQTLLHLSLVKALMADYDGAKTTVSQALSGTRSLVIPFFVTQLLATAIIFGGYALLIIPGILISIWFSLFTFVFLDQGKKGMMALLTSREYVRGYFPIVFLYPIVLGLIVYGLVLIPTTILENIGMEDLSGVISLIANFVSAPITLLYSIGIYRELKNIKGEVTVENFASRRTKYIALGVLGALALIGLLAALMTLLPMLIETLQDPSSWPDPNNIDGVEQPSPSLEEDFYLPEAV